MNILIVIIILYLLLRISAKYLFPYLIKRYLNKIKRQFEEKQSPGETSSQSPNKIKINYPSRSKHNTDPEYTPYEEIVEEDNHNSTSNK